MIYSDQERADIIRALKALLVATAEFWDTLREVEREHSVEIEYSDDMVGMLAGDLNIPPSCQDLKDADVWKAFLEDVKVHYDV